jgi:transposase, IS30 family
MVGKQLPRERVRAFMDLLIGGVPPDRAARLVGVSSSWASETNRRLGGVYRPPGTTYNERYLDREQRYELARLHDAKVSMRKIAAALGVDPSTVSRELKRNRDPATGRYQPERADRMAWERQRRPKTSKLGRDPALRAEVQQLLSKRLSPEQVSGRLRVLFPNNQQMRISHETIYQSLFVYPRGELQRELKAALRTGRAARRPRGHRENRGKILDAVSIHDRPEEVEGRLVPGHHEGDLIKGTVASNSAVGTLVERTTGYLNLLHLPDGYHADKVEDAIVARMSELPTWFAKTLTWDRGSEMKRHAHITARTGIQVYFADPYSPHQRGSNENVNGLIREYLPKSTDLSVHSAADLQRVQDELNDRPRKRLGFYTPREALAKLLAEDRQRVATTP